MAKKEKEEKPKFDTKTLETSLVEQTGDITQFISGVKVEILTDNDYTQAMAANIQVKERRERAEKFFKELMAPLKQVIADMQIKINDTLQPIRDTEAKLKKAIIDYADKVEAEIEAERVAEEARRAQANADLAALAEAAGEPVMPVEEAPAPLFQSSLPTTVKTETHVGGLTKIPKWKLTVHPEFTSDSDEDIWLNDPRANGIDKRLFKLDRGRVTAWNKSKIPMEGITHYYGKTTTSAKRQS